MSPIAAAPRALSLRSPWSDILLAACLVGVAALGVVAGDGAKRAGDLDPDSWWTWLLVVSPSLPVVFRRSHTTVATVASVVAQIIVWGVGFSSPFLAPLVLIYTSAAEPSDRGRRLAFAASCALTAMTLLGVLVAPDVAVDLLFLTALSCACAYVLGVNSSDQRAAAARLAAELAVAEVNQSVARERAAVAERQRVAREVHDIVGHSLSVIAVRSEAAKRVGSSDPSVAVAAAEASGDIARTALADVRRVLAGLRESDVDADLSPVASLDDLPALVAATEDAGVAIELLEPLPGAGAVGAAIGVSAYRIVQEALTNVIRHAGADAAVELRVAVNRSELVIDVVDDGAARRSKPSEHGTGITGMQERVAVLGGTIEVGPRALGGFGVSVSLPLQPVGVVS